MPVRAFLVAVHDIPPNVELTFDYGKHCSGSAMKIARPKPAALACLDNSDGPSVAPSIFALIGPRCPTVRQMSAAGSTCQWAVNHLRPPRRLRDLHVPRLLVR